MFESDNKPFNKTRHIVKEHGNIRSSVKIASMKRHYRTARFWSAGRTELQDLGVLKHHTELLISLVYNGYKVAVAQRHELSRWWSR